MQFRFFWNNEKERKEIEHIISVEFKSHFGKKIIEILENNSIVVNIPNNIFFDDLIKAENKISEKGYMTDFFSEVIENLSFVPRYEVN